MKKLTSILLVLVAIGMISSCKPREKCPAYGKNATKKHQHSAHS